MLRLFNEGLISSGQKKPHLHARPNLQRRTRRNYALLSSYAKGLLDISRDNGDSSGEVVRVGFRDKGVGGALRIMDKSEGQEHSIKWDI